MVADNTPASLRQGDPRLIDSPLAQELLTAATPAHLAYTGLDGDPRNIPINFHWTGTELVLGAFAGTYKIAALRARPRVAVTIATHHDGAKVLLLRGDVVVSEVAGLLGEYAIAHRRTMGNAASDPYLAAINIPELPMVRIALTPSWVGILDFNSRMPQRTPRVVREALR